MKRFLPLFFVSFTAVGYEIALTRYFAVAKWSEYGYWVISIVMAGFALSGVVLALCRDWFVRHSAVLMAALPAALLAAAALGFFCTIINPFNPLQLQNPATFASQLWNIGGYYAGLLPFFFLAGLFIGLNFVLNAGQIGRAYGYDLTGAGAGALVVLLLMFLVPPFRLVPVLLAALLGAAVFGLSHRRLGLIATGLVFIAAEALLLLGPQASYNDFKAIYAPLHTPDARIVARVNRPSGEYLLLDDFTERVDTDISNNAAMLGLHGPPQTFGLYRDGTRIAALPKGDRVDVGYAGATLGALPYEILRHPRVLLVGASGGFRAAEAQALGARQVQVLEPEPVVREAIRHGLGPAGPTPRQAAAGAISGASPIAAARAGGPYELIDIAPDFLDSAEANASALTADAITGYLRHLQPGGIVSIPVSIRDFPSYAIRMLATVRAALVGAGIADPAQHVVAYRSAWNVRLLVSNAPWTRDQLAAVRQFCDDRSFDVSYYPGIDPAAVRARIYNDLPAVGFAEGEVESSGPDDAIADEAAAVLAGSATASQEAFNLRPATWDRPAFYAILRLGQLRTILKRLEILPQAEIGALVNLAVLAQAVVIAALVLLVPLLASGSVRAEPGQLVRALLYFPALGLGFLFIEIFAIEKASFYLNDRTTGFALVLTGMLIFSGVGSMLSSRLGARRGLRFTAALVVIWSGLLLAWLQPAMLASLNWPWLVRGGLVLAVIAPVSLALGLPFPLGLAQTGSGRLLAWAWGLNGAFSVVATPVANLVVRQAGFQPLLLGAAMLYILAFATFPASRKRRQWQELPAALHGVD
ncbi:MAG: hypothetical protein JO110_08655 [Acetobacteraceae bacterium]|nr:hypothetical protein [Acetobacteraceae bacterium]